MIKGPEMQGGLQSEPGSIGYGPELSALVHLIKSNTPEGQRVIEMLKSGDEYEIRRMLQNFGNPNDELWSDVVRVSPWADWQVDQAISDLNMIKPPQPQAGQQLDFQAAAGPQEGGGTLQAAGFWYW